MKDYYAIIRGFLQNLQLEIKHENQKEGIYTKAMIIWR